MERIASLVLHQSTDGKLSLANPGAWRMKPSERRQRARCGTRIECFCCGNYLVETIKEHMATGKDVSSTCTTCNQLGHATEVCEKRQSEEAWQTKSWKQTTHFAESWHTELTDAILFSDTDLDIEVPTDLTHMLSGENYHMEDQIHSLQSTNKMLAGLDTGSSYMAFSDCEVSWDTRH